MKQYVGNVFADENEVKRREILNEISKIANDSSTYLIFIQSVAKWAGVRENLFLELASIMLVLYNNGSEFTYTNIIYNLKRRRFSREHSYDEDTLEARKTVERKFEGKMDLIQLLKVVVIDYRKYFDNR